MEKPEQFDRLANAALTSASFVKRKDSLTELATFDHPRAIEVLQKASASDRNDQVRKLAAELLAAKTATPAAPAPDAPSAQPDTPPARKASKRGKPAEPAWQCGFCGMENTGDLTTCAYCKAARPSAEAEAFTFPKIEERVSDRDVFLLNPVNRAFANGQTRRLVSSGYGCFAIFFIPFLLIGAAFLVYGVTNLFQWQQLNSEGVTTRGKFIDRRISTDSDDDRTYYATFQFEAGGDTYVVEQDVDADTYNRAELGAIIDVQYLPYDPQQARVAGTDTTPEGAFILLFGLCWNGIVWLIALAGVKAYRTDRALERSGQLVSGEVVSASGRRSNKGRFMLNVQYRFRTPDSGETITGSSSATLNKLPQPLPPGGTPLAIVYRDRKTYKVL
jgi:hypothetical protein